jgi:transcriptional regulator with XRE-family HTH domain
MANENRPRGTKAKIAAARRRVEAARRDFAHKPSPSEFLTPQEMVDAAPFYFVLREYIRQLKKTREAAGLTLADISARTGMAVEYLSRLETGAQTNPTWKTLGTYAKALGGQPQLTLTLVGSTAVLEQKIGPERRYVRNERRESAVKLTPELSLAVNGHNG